MFKLSLYLISKWYNHTQDISWLKTCKFVHLFTSVYCCQCKVLRQIHVVVIWIMTPCSLLHYTAHPQYENSLPWKFQILSDRDYFFDHVCLSYGYIMQNLHTTYVDFVTCSGKKHHVPKVRVEINDSFYYCSYEIKYICAYIFLTTSHNSSSHSDRRGGSCCQVGHGDLYCQQNQ
jgi:hypothetical protein